MKNKVSILCYFMAGMFIFAVALCFNLKLLSVQPVYIVNSVVDLFAMLVSIMIFISCLQYLRKQRSDFYFLLLSFIEFCTFFFDMCACLLRGKSQFATLNLFMNTMGFVNCLLLFFIAWFYQIEIMKLSRLKNRKITTGVCILTFCCLLAIFLNCFFGFYFVVEPSTGNYVRGKYFLFSYVYYAVMYTISIIVLLTNKMELQIKISFLLFNLTPCIAGFVQLFAYGLSLIQYSIFIVYFILYINLQVSMHNKIEVTRSQLMLSQIQPHFLYNTFSTISALCSIDPSEAENTVNKFAKYFRGNMEIVENDSLVSVDKEIEHAKNYADIDIMRYDNIKMEYDLQDTGFYIPALTIQPLVENAIRHGLRGKSNGIVKISSYKKGTFYYIKIEDNGKGFDVNSVLGKLSKDKSSRKSGIMNVKLRLSVMCGGIMEIKSKIDSGTEVLITIPEI